MYLSGFFCVSIHVFLQLLPSWFIYLIYYLLMGLMGLFLLFCISFFENFMGLRWFSYPPVFLFFYPLSIYISLSVYRSLYVLAHLKHNKILRNFFFKWMHADLERNKPARHVQKVKQSQSITMKPCDAVSIFDLTTFNTKQGGQLIKGKWWRNWRACGFSIPCPHIIVVKWGLVMRSVAHVMHETC